jgi:hypothetical protein
LHEDHGEMGHGGHELGQGNKAVGGAVLEPGARVRHPGRPDWGDGQIQSVVGHRVTVNFEHAGKVLVNTLVVGLEPAED